MSELLAMPRLMIALDPNQPSFAAKIKIGYHVEKFLGGEWVLMARVPTSTEGFEPLCEAIGGKVRVEDVTFKVMDGVKNYVFEKEYDDDDSSAGP